MIEVVHQGGDRFEVRIRDHVLISDQPNDAGGDDSGPTPTELFVSGLAACVAFYAGRFLRRHIGPEASFSVRCTYEMSGDRPPRVASVQLGIDVSVALSDQVRDALVRSAEHCTVHNSLRTPPSVSMSVRDAVYAEPVT